MVLNYELLVEDLLFVELLVGVVVRVLRRVLDMGNFLREGGGRLGFRG